MPKGGISKSTDVNLAEYNSLKCELRDRQNSRYHILAFILAGIGALFGIGITSVTKVDISDPVKMVISGLVFLFSYAFLITGISLTINHTQRIDHISNYIRYKFKRKFPDLRWDDEWHGYRKKYKGRPYDIIGKGKSFLFVFFGLVFKIIIFDLAYTLIIFGPIYLISMLINLGGILEFIRPSKLYEKLLNWWTERNKNILPMGTSKRLALGYISISFLVVLSFSSYLISENLPKTMYPDNVSEGQIESQETPVTNSPPEQGSARQKESRDNVIKILKGDGNVIWIILAFSIFLRLLGMRCFGISIILFASIIFWITWYRNIFGLGGYGQALMVLNLTMGIYIVGLIYDLCYRETHGWSDEWKHLPGYRNE